MNTGPQPVFRALADPTRRQILRLLAGKDLAIADIAAHFDMTRAAVKKHLIVLEQGGLVHSRPKGRERVNSLVPLPLKSAFEWLGYFDSFWDQKLSALQTEIDKEFKEKELEE